MTELGLEGDERAEKNNHGGPERCAIIRASTSLLGAGISGIGKELFCRACVYGSRRSDGKYIYWLHTLGESINSGHQPRLTLLATTTILISKIVAVDAKHG